MTEEPSWGETHADAVPLHGPRLQEDPSRLYREMRREHGPVVPVLLEGGAPAWLVIGYREVHQVVTDSRLFARDPYRCRGPAYVPPPSVGYQHGSLLFTDGPEYKRRIGAVSDALARVDQFALRIRCERVADELIDAFAGHGEAELISQYARRMPVLVVAEMIGLPASEVEGVERDLLTMTDGREGVIEAYERFIATITGLLEAKHERPGPDVVSHMLAYPGGVTDEEVTQDLLAVLSGGQDSTANWIGNTLRLMLTDERFSLTLSGGRSSVGQALNEVLWEDTPTRHGLGRWATRDTLLGDRRITAGDVIIVGLAAANADPRVRQGVHGGSAANHAHLSFGHGDHRCPHPAPELAEIIARTGVEVLLDRLPDVRLAVAAEELEWRPAFHARGLVALPVRFSPTHGAEDV